jgi:hypothetical protein
MLGLKCDEVPFDRVTSAVAALACLPMYMVANVHGWTADRQFRIPLLNIGGSEAVREAFVIGEEEARLHIASEHLKVVDSMLGDARAPDRVIYEYALETLKEYLAVAQPGIVDKLRTAVARMIVHVAQASGKGLLGTGPRVSPEERACISHIAVELRLGETPQAAEILAKL